MRPDYSPWRYWAAPHVPTTAAKLALNSMYGKAMTPEETTPMYPIHHARRVETTQDGTTIVGPDRLTIIGDLKGDDGATVGYLAVKVSDPINGPVERLDGDVVNVMFIQQYTMSF